MPLVLIYIVIISLITNKAHSLTNPHASSSFAMPASTILFDFDGIVAETEPLIFTATNIVLEQFGIQWNTEDCAKLLKVG